MYFGEIHAFFTHFREIHVFLKSRYFKFTLFGEIHAFWANSGEIHAFFKNTLF